MLRCLGCRITVADIKTEILAVSEWRNKVQKRDFLISSCRLLLDNQRAFLFLLELEHYTVHPQTSPNMTTLRPFLPSDLFKFNAINLDNFTETFNLTFYLTYLAKHPDLFHVAEHASGQRMGYSNP